MKLPRLDINFYKVIVGVGFSLLWARIMYHIWDQPSFITFIWFYLGVGSVLLKWVLFVIMDRITTRVRVRVVKRELERSSKRVHEAKDLLGKQEPQIYPVARADVALDRELKQLEQDVLSLGSMAEKALEQAVEGLLTRNTGLARHTVEHDRIIDRTEFAIRQDCLMLLADSRLGSNELRYVAGVLDIIKELERMGDYAEGIANISLMIGNHSLIVPLADIPRMTQMDTEMLRGSMEAFSEKDLEKAARLFKMDDEVDALYDQVFRELVLSMIADPKTITQATRLIWAVHNLERFADRVTNICEQVAFSVTGKMVDMGSSKS